MALQGWVLFSWLWNMWRIEFGDNGVKILLLSIPNRFNTELSYGRVLRPLEIQIDDSSRLASKLHGCKRHRNNMTYPQFLQTLCDYKTSVSDRLSTNLTKIEADTLN